MGERSWMTSPSGARSIESGFAVEGPASGFVALNVRPARGGNFGVAATTVTSSCSRLTTNIDHKR